MTEMIGLGWTLGSWISETSVSLGRKRDIEKTRERKVCTYEFFLLFSTKRCSMMESLIILKPQSLLILMSRIRRHIFIQIKIQQNYVAILFSIPISFCTENLKVS